MALAVHLFSWALALPGLVSCDALRPRDVPEVTRGTCLLLRATTDDGTVRDVCARADELGPALVPLVEALIAQADTDAGADAGARAEMAPTAVAALPVRVDGARLRGRQSRELNAATMAIAATVARATPASTSTSPLDGSDGGAADAATDSGGGDGGGRATIDDAGTQRRPDASITIRPSHGAPSTL